MIEVKNILLVGVGGQGTILASQILSAGLVAAGYDVKMSEVHGMAQRGGSVTTQVRFGEKVYAPIIGKGQADILVAFEEMESLRWLEYLKPEGKAVINEYRIPSVPILSGRLAYPQGILHTIKAKVDTTVVNAAKIAEELGNSKTMNVILLGVLVKAMNLTALDWETAIRECVKEKFVDINLKAFKTGLAVLE